MELLIPVWTKPISERKRAFVAGDRPVRTDTPDRKAYKATVTQYVIAALNEVGRQHLPLLGPLELRLAFCFARPASYPKKPTEGKPWPYDHIVKPDIDNCIKVVTDVLTACGVWQDDAQVCMESALKLYADREGTIIYVRQLGGVTDVAEVEHVLAAIARRG